MNCSKLKLSITLGKNIGDYKADDRVLGYCNVVDIRPATLHDSFETKAFSRTVHGPCTEIIIK